MTNEDRIEQLNEAEDMINDAIDLIVDVCKGTDEENRSASYIVPHLQHWISDSVASSYNSIADLKGSFMEVIDA